VGERNAGGLRSGWKPGDCAVRLHLRAGSARSRGQPVSHTGRRGVAATARSCRVTARPQPRESPVASAIGSPREFAHAP